MALLTVRPMKGTAPRQGNDAAERDALAASAKNRAENLMIVDLIRNDLSRIAESGSVAVSDLFQVETYPTLHTMVSTVTARKRAGTGMADILRALFPCGSVTGAPKIRAMEILRATRKLAAWRLLRRCSAVSRPTARRDFNVAIRTLTICGRYRRDGHRRRGGAGFPRGIANMPNACSRRASSRPRANRWN